MSLAGFAARRGSTLTIRRATASERADGSTRNAWADVATLVPAPLEVIGTEVAQRLWGAETRARYRALLPIDCGAVIGDGIVVTAGAQAGRSFRLVESNPHPYGGSPHIEAGLALTPEAFA